MKKIKNITLGFALIISLLVNPTKVIAERTEIVNPLNLTLEQQVVYFSELYQGDSKLLLKVMECESGGDHSNVGDGGLSRGVYQFQKSSFERMEKAFGEDLNYQSSFDQVKLGVWAITNGYGREWTAYRAIMNGGTYSFYSRQLHRSFTVKCKL